MHKKTLFSIGFFLVCILVIGLVGTAILIPIAYADTITVDTIDDELNDDGDCSLREAVVAANTDTAVDNCTAGSGSDTITVPPGTYTLSLAGAGEDAAQTGDLDLTADVTINGSGQNDTVIDGANADRVFDVPSGVQATISGVTVKNGSATSGGGINVLGTLSLSASRVTTNTATSLGGGIYAGGTLTVTHSRIDSNQANSGGGVFVSFLPTAIINSEISSNSVTGGGGGVYSSGTLALVNSTLSGNSADGGGGGLYVVEGIDIQLHNMTISNNTADADGNDNGDGGGVRSLGGVSLANTLIGGNTDATSGGTVHPDCSGSVTSEAFNLIANVAGCNISGDTTGNITGADPMLGPLQNNGGSTFTHALLGGSPAIDAGNPGDCRDQNDDLLITDQRGFSRPGGSTGLCDIGAYESDGTAPPPMPTATPIVTPTATPVLDNIIYLPIILKQ